MNALHALILNLIALNRELIEALSDGKITLPEKVKIGAAGAPIAFTNWKMVASQYKGMTAEQLTSLHGMVAVSVEISNAKAEVITKAVLKIGAGFGEIQKALSE